MVRLSTILPLAFLLLLSAGCGAPRMDIDDLCSIYRAHPQWEEGMAGVVERWGIPQEVIMAVIRHESSFQGEARAPRRHYLGFIPGERLSSAYGYAQALDRTWAEYQERTGNSGAERDEFMDAADFVGWYLNRTHRSLQLSRTDGYHLYLAYHEGHRGFLSEAYKRHPRLMEVATRVRETQQRYRQQIRQCRSEIGSEKKREKRFTLKINEGLPERE